MPSSKIAKLVLEETGEGFLLEKRETLIGRISKGSEEKGEVPDIAVSDALVSRKHAVITVDDQEYFVRNFGRNGTLVNGKQVPISYLNSGDLIKTGNTVFRFVVEGEEETSSKYALIVDKDADSIRDVERILKAEGYAYVVVNSGTEAIEELRSKRFSLVITEVYLPNLDGFELCRYIRRTPDIDNLVIVILTVLSHAPEIEHGKRQGADFYLSKPLESDELKECLRKVQSRHEE